MSSIKDIKLGDNSIYFKMSEGVNRFRIISEFTEVFTIFNQEEKTAQKYLSEELACENPRFNDKKSTKQRFAAWVLDRKDGEVRMAEFGTSIMGQIQTLSNDPDYEFTSIPAYDMKCLKEGQGMETSYTITPSPATELTTAEKEKIMALEGVAEWFAKQPNVITKKNDSSIPF